MNLFGGIFTMDIVILILLILLGLLVFLFALNVVLVMPSRKLREQRDLFFHVNFAHRGLHSRDKSIPENSLSAFKAAVEAGYGIELDLQFSKDEQIVVFHDDTLNRVCGVDGRVDAYTLSELREMHLCGTDERIPLFSEVLELVGGKVPLLVEFKNGPKNDLLCEKTLPMLRAYKGDFCIESFTPFIVKWFKKNAPDILRGQLSAPAKEFKGELQPFAAFMLSHCYTNVLCRPHFISYHKEKNYLSVRLADRLGAMRFVWTVRPSDDIRALERKNDAVIFEFYTPGLKY